MRESKIAIEDAVLLDNKLWFVLRDYKSLAVMDIRTKETKSYEIPSNGLYTQIKAFGSIALVGRKIYLIPHLDKVLLQFDVDSEEFVEIGMDSSIIQNKDGLFMGVGIYQNYLFIMGADVPTIIRVNTLNNNVDYITDWCQMVEPLIFDSKDAYFRKQTVIIGDKLYVPFCNANAVLEIDCNSMQSVIHSMGEEKQGYSGICFDGEAIWLSPRRNGHLIKWHLNSNQIDSMQISGLKALGNVLTYTGIIFYDKKILLLPMMRRQTLCIEQENVAELSGEYLFVQQNEKHLIFYEGNTGNLTIIDRKLDVLSEIMIDRVKVNLEKILRESKNFVIENASENIRDFINVIKKD